MNKDEFQNINIDELLNSFADGELGQRQHTKVQRLIKHDPQIAERLQKIQNCKRLVSSLPYAEAPQGTLENIKATVEKRPLPVHRTRDRHEERKGSKHLLVRRLISAAAMIALVGVLGEVIYSILAPQPPVDEQPLAYETWQPKQFQPAGEIGIDRTMFRGKLILKTTAPAEVVAFINGAIQRNIAEDEQAVASAELKDSYILTCSRRTLSSFLSDLGNIWDKFDSATLFVETDQPETQVAVAAVVPEQILEIANQDEIETQVKAAQYFAALNTKPGQDTMLAEDNAPITIPKPVLTSGANRPQTEGEKRIEKERKVVLTIVVTDSD